MIEVFPLFERLGHNKYNALLLYPLKFPNERENSLKKDNFTISLTSLPCNLVHFGRRWSLPVPFLLLFSHIFSFCNNKQHRRGQFFWANLCTPYQSNKHNYHQPSSLFYACCPFISLLLLSLACSSTYDINVHSIEVSTFLFCTLFCYYLTKKLLRSCPWAEIVNRTGIDVNREVGKR